VVESQYGEDSRQHPLMQTRYHARLTEVLWNAESDTATSTGSASRRCVDEIDYP
jgi:hypothetical protein